MYGYGRRKPMYRKHIGHPPISGSDTEYFWDQFAKNKNSASVKEREQQVSFKMSEEIPELTQDELACLIESNDSISIERSGPDSSNSIIPMQGSFDELDIPTFCTENIHKMGYKIPTPIQRHAIPLALQKFDLMCCSQTGTSNLNISRLLLPLKV